MGTDMPTESRMHQPGGLLHPGWYRITTGQHAGRVHISGWMKTAFLLGDGNWVAVAVCPICHALVIANDGTTEHYGDQTWAHEQWHARNDFPIPDGI